MRPSIILSEKAEARLRRIMEIRKLDSLEAAAEIAFEEGERKAMIIEDLYANLLPDEAWGEAFDPHYDLEKLSALEVPRSYKDASVA